MREQLLEKRIDLLEKRLLIAERRLRFYQDHFFLHQGIKDPYTLIADIEQSLINVDAARHERERLVTSLNRGQVNFLLAAMSPKYEELQQLLEQALEQRQLNPSRIPSYSQLTVQDKDRITQEELIESLDDKQLQVTIDALKNNPYHLKNLVLEKVTNHICIEFEKAQTEGKSFGSMIGTSLRGVELLVALGLRAEAIALHKCPADPKCTQACDECRTKYFWGCPDPETSNVPPKEQKPKRSRRSKTKSHEEPEE